MPTPEISPPPPIGTTKVSISGACSSISSADRALPGDDLRVVERVDEGQPLFLGQLERAGIGLVEHLAMQDHRGAMALGLHHLDRRGRLGHHDRDRNAEPPAVIGEPLRMVARRRRDHAARAGRRVHQQQFVERAALLVGGGELEILELEIDVRAGQLGQACG